MSIKELIRPDLEIVPTKRKKPQRNNWNVLLIVEKGRDTGCVRRVLCGVFNKTVEQAQAHLEEASNSGKSVIMTSSRDVVETLCKQAQDTTDRNRATCWARAKCNLNNVAFVPDPF